jgi:hypothetical protein
MAAGDNGSRTVSVANTGTLDASVHIKDFTTNGDLFAGSNGLTLTNTEVFQIPANATKNFTVNYSLPKAAGNEYQAKSGTALINFEAVQVANNPNQGQNWGRPVNNNSYGINVQKSSMSYGIVSGRFNSGVNSITVTLRDDNNNPILNVPQSEFRWYFTDGSAQDVTGDWLSDFPNFSANNGTYTWSRAG